MWKISTFTAMLMAGMLFVTGCGSSGMESVRENPDAGKSSVVQESVSKAEAGLQDSVEERGSIESKDSVPFLSVRQLIPILLPEQHIWRR